MKKRKFGLTLVLFIIVLFSGEVLAADITNPVKLNVNVKKATNRHYYTNTAGTNIAVNLGWTEKMMLGETGEIAISVTISTLTTTPSKGDLIIKVDQVATDSANNMDITSGWLKFDLTGGISQTVEVVTNGNHATGRLAADNVDKTDLNTLCLLKQVAPGTIYLFNYYSTLDMYGHIIFTAILVNDASLDDGAQVLGVDVQSIYFNYSGATEPNPEFWLDLIKSD
jgi:hypothetical protein